MKAIAVHFAVEKPSVESSETIIDILYTRFAFHCVYVCVCVRARSHDEWLGKYFHTEMSR